MNNATRTRLWGQTDQPRQLSNQRNTHQYVNSKECRSLRTIFSSLRWYGCQYVRSLRQPSKSLSVPQRTVQSLTFKIKLMFPQRKVVFITHWGNHYVMKRPEYWPKSFSFDTNIICRGDEAFKSTTNTLKATIVPLLSELVDHAEQWLSKMAGVIPSVAGKRKIVLPSVVILLWFACLWLLLNKNPSANGQQLSQNFALLEIRELERTTTCLSLSCVRFFHSFQAQVTKVFRCTVTRNYTSANVRFTVRTLTRRNLTFLTRIV